MEQQPHPNRLHDTHHTQTVRRRQECGRHRYRHRHRPFLLEYENRFGQHRDRNRGWHLRIQRRLQNLPVGQRRQRPVRFRRPVRPLRCHDRKNHLRCGRQPELDQRHRRCENRNPECRCRHGSEQGGHGTGGSQELRRHEENRGHYAGRQRCRRENLRLDRHAECLHRRCEESRYGCPCRSGCHHLESNGGRLVEQTNLHRRQR